MHKKLYIFFILGFVCSQISYSQLPEQDCSSAIPVCQDTYFQPFSYTTFGSIQELNATNSSCLNGGEENSVWYIFTVNVGGSLEFEITPNDINDDYDWAIYDLTNSNCTGILNGTAPEVRCNYSAIPGLTGLSNPYTQVSVPQGGPNQCAPMNVLVGETYVLIINNHAFSNSGYTLHFGGTAVIYDNVPPSPVSLDPFPCYHPDTLHLTVSEQVKCSSIAPDGSDFYITGASVVNVSAASSVSCSSGLFTNKIDILLSSPIAINGSYILHFKDGTDGNVILDNCNNELSDTETVHFKVAIADAQFGYSIIKTCAGDSFIFHDFSVGDTTNAWVWDLGDGTSSTSSNPTHLYPTTGTYTVTLAITDTGGCFNTDSLVISSYVEAPVAGFFVSSPPYCANVPVDFFNSSTGQGLHYDWSFGSTATSTDDEPEFTFPSGGIFTVELVATDSIGCHDTVSANLVINPGVLANFDYVPSVLCVGDTITFSNTSSGNPTSIHWDFGNGVIDSVSSTVKIAYGDTGTYLVSLILEDSICRPDTIFEALKVSDYPIVNLGPDTGICIGESYYLSAGNPGKVYNWSTGETTPSIVVNIVPKEIILFVSDHGCIGKDTVFIDNDCPFFIPTAFTPNGDGINDLYNIITDGTVTFRLNIFNRWGQMVFTTIDPTQGWNGTFEGVPEEMGTYIYVLQVLFDNGVTRTSQGNITLIR